MRTGFLAAVVVVAGAWLIAPAGRVVNASLPLTDAGRAPVFEGSFWDHWGDGRAELSGYDLVFPRYGEERRGMAVAIFVTETFSNSLRVKADPGKHPAADEIPVLKVHLGQDV